MNKTPLYLKLKLSTNNNWPVLKKYYNLKIKYIFFLEDSFLFKNSLNKGIQITVTSQFIKGFLLHTIYCKTVLKDKFSWSDDVERFNQIKQMLYWMDHL